MRCPNCNKFVPYDEPEAEVQNSDLLGSTATVTTRIVLKCADCSEELKEAEIDAEVEIEHNCNTEDEKEFEWVDEPSDAEGFPRTQDKDRHGKPIKNRRYMKTFYGFTATGKVKCCHCAEEIELEFKGEEQASGFNELV
jgi:phage FluMu protein Com